MDPLICIDYNFTVFDDGSIKMDEELDPKMIGLKNGDIFLAYVNSGSIFLRKYKPVIRLDA